MFHLRLRAGPMQPGEKAAQGDPTNTYKYIIEGNEDERAIFFSVVTTDRTRGSRHKLKTMNLNTRKTFTGEGDQTLQQILGEVLESYVWR